MEHSPTLKLIHSSEVAPGASSASFSSSSVVSSERKEDHSLGHLKQEASATERPSRKRMESSKITRDEKTLWSVIAEYKKEISGLNKRLDGHTIKLAELQHIVEKQMEDAKSEPKLSSGIGSSRSKEEDDEQRFNWTEAVTTTVLLIITFAALYQSGKNQGEAIYYKSLYHGQQQERNNSASAPPNNIEYLNCENKAQIRVTVERIIDGVPDRVSHVNNDTQQSNASESDTQLGKSDRSWSSLVWKKQ